MSLFLKEDVGCDGRTSAEEEVGEVDVRIGGRFL